MLEDAYVNESMQTLKNLEGATRKLSSLEMIFENDSRNNSKIVIFILNLFQVYPFKEKASRADIEKMLKQAADKPSDDPNKFPIALKDIPLNNTIGILNEIVTDEIEKLK